jgi:hypothetical protein
MQYFFLIVFAAVSLVFVARPLFQSKKQLRYEDELFLSGGEKQLAFLKTKKQLILDNISEHEFEFAMGKLSQEDFDRLRLGCEKDLKALNKSIESFEIKKEIDDLIESEVSARRKLK